MNDGLEPRTMQIDDDAPSIHNYPLAELKAQVARGYGRVARKYYWSENCCGSWRDLMNASARAGQQERERTNAMHM